MLDDHDIAGVEQGPGDEVQSLLRTGTDDDVVDRGAEPMGAAYFGFYLLAMGKGRPRRLEVMASSTARSAAGSLMRTPPTALTNTS